MGEHERYRRWDAAYVLGALDADDRHRFDEHLAVCADCRAAVGELARMPDLLGLVPAGEVAGIGAGADGAGTDGTSSVAAAELGIAARRARTRRRRRRVFAVAAAGVLALLAGGAGVLVGRDQPTATVSPAVTVSANATHLLLAPTVDGGMTADVTMASRPWGTRIDWSCTYPAGAGVQEAVYELVLVDGEGRDLVVATWAAYGQRAGGLGASTSVPLGDITRVEIRFQGRDSVLAAARM